MAVLGLHCLERAFSSCGVWASHHRGFSRCRAWAPECQLGRCGAWALDSEAMGSSWTRD